jgi:hypothetical protein
MRFSGISGRLRALAPIVGAIGSAVALVALAPMAHAHILVDCVATSTASPCPTPSPTPSPVPTNAFLSLDVTAGDPNTQITVSGSAFLANESTSLYWDQPSKVAGASNADVNGNFTTKVKPFAGDAPGVHRLCASVPPNPCASFTLQALATSPSPQDSPSPSPDTSPSPSPSPFASPTDSSVSPTPAAATINGIDLMLKPPFVILPIIAGIGLAIALTYWILSVVLRPKPTVLKSVAVAHLATRPDYAAGFGTPPPAAAEPAPPPSAWADALPAATVPPETAPSETLPEAPPPEASAAAEFAPAAEQAIPPATPPDDLAAAPDEPPDLPEPGHY